MEILPRDHSEPESSAGGSRVWLTVDSHGDTRRVYIAKPGLIATILLVLAFGVLLTMSFVVAMLLLGISVVVVSGLLVYGLIRGALNRIR